MKPGIVFPNPLGAELAEAPRSAEAGASGIVARPEAFVDDSFGLRVSPEEITAALSDAGLELAGIVAARPILGEGGETETGVAHIRSCLDLADALRDYAPADALPVVICNAGAGDREAHWPALVEALKALGEHAEARLCVLALRPDRATLVDRSRNAVKLLTEVGSSYVQAVLDAAATVGDKDTLDAAVERLKENIVCAFARDVKFDEDGKPLYSPLGGGVINYDQYVQLLGGASGCGYLVAGELSTEGEAKVALAKLRGFIRA